MGHYSHLRFTANIRENRARVVSTLYRSRQLPLPWRKVATLIPEYDWLALWAAYDRAHFIPFGACMLEDPEESRRDQDAWDPHSRVWRVRCSIKYAEPEVKFFLDHVLSRLIADPVCAGYQWDDEEPGTIQVVPLNS